ncbi:hypothetical protein FWH58_00885 [Candidatus Saccharibacteria bacterium]|nr:hypothetical protein [Candidatus Saccharibacteria bacterium]
MFMKNRQKFSQKSRIVFGLMLVMLVGMMGFATLKTDDALAVDCGKTTTFFDWGCKDVNGDGVINEKDNQIIPVLMTIFNWLSMGVGLVVIGGIIYGGITYSTSSGDSGRAQEAVKQIRNAVIALIMYFAMWALLNWLVPGGLFN